MNYAHYINILIQGLNWMAVNLPWNAIIGSGALSVLLVGPNKMIKAWFKHHEQIMPFVVGAAGVLAVAIHGLMTVPAVQPALILVEGLAVAYGTQPFFKLMVKPLAAYLGAKIAKWWGERVAQAVHLDEARSALEPAGGISAPALAAAPVQRAITIQDFKR